MRLVYLYICRSGIHYWRKQEDAVKCCDPRWRRVLSFNGGDNSQIVDGTLIGREWIEDPGYTESATECKMHGYASNPYKWSPD